MSIFLYAIASGNGRFLYLWMSDRRATLFVGKALHALLSNAYEARAAPSFVLSDGLQAAPRCIFSSQNRGKFARNCAEKK